MNVGCRIELSGEATRLFKETQRKPATRLNVKLWALRVMSESLGTEVTSNFSNAQKKRMKKDGIRVPGEEPTKVAEKTDKHKKKKFSLKKK